jgi:hypothetical protein
MAEQQLSDSDKLDLINKRIKRVEMSTHLHTLIVIIGFLGIVSLGTLIAKIKNVK